MPAGRLPLDGPALGVLGGVAAAMVLALRARALARRAPDPALARPGAPGAAVAVALVASVAALLLWLANPFAGLLTVPAAHLWLLVLLTGAQPRRRVRAALLALGALPPLLVAVYYLFALSIDPLGGAWYLLLLVTGHRVGLLTGAGRLRDARARCAPRSAGLRRRRRPEEPAAGARRAGPGSYAGPGCLDAGPGVRCGEDARRALETSGSRLAVRRGEYVVDADAWPRRCSARRGAQACS